MNDAVAPADAAPAAAPTTAPAGLTAGALLRQAREAAGLHVAAMAVSLKVPVSKLEALENDRYDLLPDAVFARALASSVCRSLRIEPGPVLDRLPQSAKPRLVQDDDGINAPFRSPRDAVAQPWRDQLTRPVSLAVGAIALGIVAVLVWPHGQPGESAAVALKTDKPLPVPQPAPAGESLKTETATSAGLMPASVNVSGPATAPAAPSAAVQPTPAPAAAAASATLAAAPAAAPVTAAAPAPASAGSAPAPTGDLVFRASGESWIEVRDARGAVPLRKVLAAGESAAISGARPLQVTVGNVDATELDVRGKRYDLKSIARDNVARFQVK